MMLEIKNYPSCHLTYYITRYFLFLCCMAHLPNFYFFLLIASFLDFRAIYSVKTLRISLFPTVWSGSAVCPSPKIHNMTSKVSLKATFLSICQGAIDILREEEEVFYVKVCNPSFPFGGFSIPPPLCLGNSPTIAFYYFKEWHIKMPQFNVSCAQGEWPDGKINRSWLGRLL